MARGSPSASGSRRLPYALASAGVKYTLVDDVHFLASGFELDQLHGDYVCEDRGQTVRVFPGLKILRYLLPFRPREEAIAFLRESAQRHPGGMAAMGDDCEKFGAWPGTYDIELPRWLAGRLLRRPGEFVRLAGHHAAGRIHPRTSAPGPRRSAHRFLLGDDGVDPAHQGARTLISQVSQEFANRPDVLRFLRGGPWRAFFTKYAGIESAAQKDAARFGQATQLRFQANEPGKKRQARLCRKSIFCARNAMTPTGTASSAASTRLICAPNSGGSWSARKLCWTSWPAARDGLQIEQTDFDADGSEELYVTSKSLAALVRPADGGTLAALDFRPSAVTLINSMQRRPEAYHSRLQRTPRPLLPAARSPRFTIRCAARKTAWSAFCVTIAGPEMPSGFCSFRPARPSTITRS